MRDGLSNIQVRRGANQTLAGTGGFTIKLQHSDTLVGTDFADVPAAQVLGTAPVVDDNGDDNIIAGGLGYVGAKRYVRAVLTGTANTDAVAFIVASLGKPHRAPVDRVGAAQATT